MGDQQNGQPSRPVRRDRSLPSLRGLKWLTIVAPVLFFGLLEVIRFFLLERSPSVILLLLILGGSVVIATRIFSEIIFGVIDRMQVRLVQQNRELLAVHQAGLDIAGELDLEVVLQKIVDCARELVGARYGALSLLGDGPGIEVFLTSGFGCNARSELPSPPIEYFSKPPKGRSLVSVPIVSQGHLLGSLYVSEPLAWKKTEFDFDDEETLHRFATQAALAIENARLHRRVQALVIAAEREWIARELHDTLAQVLGFVNTKAQAAGELLRRGQNERAHLQIEQLAEMSRSAYADVREGILGLRASLAPERGFLDTFQAYLDQWQEQSGVEATLTLGPLTRASLQLTPLAEIQLLRILQEALSNVRKHARATQVGVIFIGTGDVAEVVVQDNGVGFDPSALSRAGFPRFGLSTMRERAEAIGGKMEIQSSPNQGARLTFRIPVVAAGSSAVGGTLADSHR